MRIRMALLTLGMLSAILLVGGWSAVLAGSAERHSGTVVAVDPNARTLALEELAAAGKTQQLKVSVPAQAQVVFSERIPDHQVTDLRHPFRDTPIGLPDIRPGDFIVVELTEKGEKVVASSVTVTFRGGAR